MVLSKRQLSQVVVQNMYDTIAIYLVEDIGENTCAEGRKDTKQVYISLSLLLSNLLSKYKGQFLFLWHILQLTRVFFFFVTSFDFTPHDDNFINNKR